MMRQDVPVPSLSSAASSGSLDDGKKDAKKERGRKRGQLRGELSRGLKGRLTELLALRFLKGAPW